MPMIIWQSILADKALSAALASANSWHLKKPQKIKRIKIELIRCCWEKGHPSPRPSSRFWGWKNRVEAEKRGSISSWETGKSRKFVIRLLLTGFLGISKPRKQAM
jgi:hypothetical protein